MYNHEWPCRDCGIRRIWIYDHERDEICRVRSENLQITGKGVWPRRREDWVCHEMWSDDGRFII